MENPWAPQMKEEIIVTTSICGWGQGDLENLDAQYKLNIQWLHYFWGNNLFPETCKEVWC